jgi:lambda family phage minor tail protein L
MIANLQGLSLGDLVVLYHLDLTEIGVAQNYYFSSTNNDGSAITFDGQAYSYAGIDITGVEWSSEGSSTGARLFLPNVNKFASGLIVAHNDLVGARITRTRTFKQFLDGEDLADPAAILGRETFVIEQKASLNSEYAEFALKPLFDVGERQIPGRVCLKSTCTHRYRVWDGSSFDYSKATCPYTGAGIFEKDGSVAASGADDECSKDLKGCRLRFGTNGTLPTRAFPGMDRSSR